MSLKHCKQVWGHGYFEMHPFIWQYCCIPMRFLHLVLYKMVEKSANCLLQFANENLHIKLNIMNIAKFSP